MVIANFTQLKATMYSINWKQVTIYKFMLEETRFGILPMATILILDLEKRLVMSSINPTWVRSNLITSSQFFFGQPRPLLHFGMWIFPHLPMEASKLLILMWPIIWALPLISCLVLNWCNPHFL